jgi:hypothetical protein
MKSGACAGALHGVHGSDDHGRRLWWTRSGCARSRMLCKTILTLAACAPSWFDDLWMTDATPVPCGMSRETVKRSDLAGHAGYGYCTSHSRWYWGLKLYLDCTGDGMPIMWCLANPKIGEREVAAALLQHNHHLIRTGQILLADKGFAGKSSNSSPMQWNCVCCAPTARTRPTNGDLGGLRQWIESVNQTLKGQLNLEDHGGRIPASVFTRAAQRLLAMAAGIWHNWTTGVTSKRSLTAYDH